MFLFDDDGDDNDDCGSCGRGDDSDDALGLDDNVYDISDDVSGDSDDDNNQG